MSAYEDYAGSQAEPASTLPLLDLRQVLEVLRRHVWLIVATTVVCMVAGVALSSQQTPRYRAGAVLRMEDARRALAGQFDGGFVDWLMWRTTPRITESAVLRENVDLAGAVVDREGLRLVIVSEGFTWNGLEGIAVASAATADTVTLQFFSEHVSARGGGKRVQAAYGAPIEIGGVRFTVPDRPGVEEARLQVVSRDRAIENLLAGISAVPRDETNLIDLSYTSTDAWLAQKVVNAAAKEFQAYNFDRQRQISVQRRTFIEDQIEQMGTHLNEAYRALSDFRRNHQTYGSREGLSTVQSGMQTLQMRREELVAEREMAKSLVASSRTRDDGDDEWYWTVATSPGIGTNPIIANLFSQLQEFATQREALVTGEWGQWSGHPEVQRLDGLIAAREQKMVEALQNHVTGLDARIAALDDLQARNLASMDQLSGTELEETWLLHEVETIRGIMEQLGTEYQRARISEAVEMPQFGIVSLATQPGKAVSRKAGRAIPLAWGLLVGLLLGGGGALVRENIDPAIRRREEIEGIFGFAALAVIPRITPLAPRFRLRLVSGMVQRRIAPAPPPEPTEPDSIDLVTHTDHLGSGPEAYRMLRTNLVFSNGGTPLRSVLVTSPSAGEGKTTTAANLAVTFAQQGLRVALLDADLRRPRLHHVFCLPRVPGLSDLLSGTHTIEQVLHKTPVSGLQVIPAGVLPHSPADLLGMDRMGKLIEELGQQFDLVLLDSPPVLAAADPSILGLQVDGTVMVVRAGKTERGAAQHAMRQLTNVGSRVVGVVLNDPDEMVSHYYYYYPSTHSA